jgi:hypothetical protein
MAPGDRLRSEYLALSIIPTGSKPQRSTPFDGHGRANRTRRRIAVGTRAVSPSELHSCAAHVGGALLASGAFRHCWPRCGDRHAHALDIPVGDPYSENAGP